MQKPTKRLSSFDILSNAYHTWRTNLRPLVHISLICLILPQFAMQLLLSGAAFDASTALWDLTSQNNGEILPALSSFLAAIQPFAFKFSVFWFLSGILFCIGYAALCHLFLIAGKNAERKVHIPLKELLIVGLKDTLKLFILALLIQIIFVLAGQLPLFKIAAMVLCSVAPVVLIAERRGVFKSLLTSFTIKYADKSSQSGFSLFFSLAGSFAFIYLVFELLFYLSGQIPYLDMSLGLSRSIFTSEIFKVLNILIDSSLLAVAITMVCAITFSFYLQARKRLSQYL